MPTPLTPFADELCPPTVLPPHSVSADGARYYRVEMRYGERKVHKELLRPTPFWGYEGMYPGPTLEVPRDKKVVVEFVNALPATPPGSDPRTRWPFCIPPDPTPNPHVFVPEQPWTVVHLHGSPSPADSDGWTDNAYFPGGSAVHHYPPQGSAALLWYHDHAHMITRLNVYAGLAGLYLVRDPAVEGEARGLPVGWPYEIPLLLQDRNLEVVADRYTGRFEYQRLGSNNVLLGSHVLVNGLITPHVKVQPRCYRLRVLNGANARFFRLRLLLPDGLTLSVRELTQVGVDGGFLRPPYPRPTFTTWDRSQGALTTEDVLVLAPAERADVLLDLTAYAAGDHVTLVDDAAGGVLRFEVQAAPPAPPAAPYGPLPESTRVQPAAPDGDPAPAVTRTIGLFLKPMGHGPPMQTINGRTFHQTVEETPVLGTAEEWAFFNFTEEDHPMHLHLVNFTVLDRRPFTGPVPTTEQEMEQFEKNFRAWLAQPPAGRPPLPPGWQFVHDPYPADANEKSPKDTVRATAQHVTRVRAEFKYHTGLYMYHCHILEHEDMDMMRPLLVMPRGMHLMTPAPPGHGHGHGP